MPRTRQGRFSGLGSERASNQDRPLGTTHLPKSSVILVLCLTRNAVPRMVMSCGGTARDEASAKSRRGAGADEGQDPRWGGGPTRSGGGAEPDVRGGVIEDRHGAEAVPG